MYKIDKRVKIINFLESIFLKEAIDKFEQKLGRKVSEEEKRDIEINWKKHSTFFTRIWLNYLSDEKLHSFFIK